MVKLTQSQLQSRVTEHLPSVKPWLRKGDADDTSSVILKSFNSEGVKLLQESTPKICLPLKALGQMLNSHELFFYLMPTCTVECSVHVNVMCTIVLLRAQTPWDALLLLRTL